MIRHSVWLFMQFIALAAFAQSYAPIILETKNVSLVFSIGNNQRLNQSYLGAKLSDTSLYKKLSGGREVYLTAGMENQFEPAIRLVHADGNPSLELTYVSHTIQTKDNVSVTRIFMNDPAYPVEVVLQYTTYFNEDVITSSVTIQHPENKPVLLTQYASNMLH